jgi:hypothetical protein
MMSSAWEKGLKLMHDPASPLVVREMTEADIAAEAALHAEFILGPAGKAPRLNAILYAPISHSPRWASRMICSSCRM